jgi:hypothetical protein
LQYRHHATQTRVPAERVPRPLCRCMSPARRGSESSCQKPAHSPLPTAFRTMDGGPARVGASVICSCVSPRREPVIGPSQTLEGSGQGGALLDACLLTVAHQQADAVGQGILVRQDVVRVRHLAHPSRGRCAICALLARRGARLHLTLRSAPEGGGRDPKGPSAPTPRLRGGGSSPTTANPS